MQLLRAALLAALVLTLARYGMISKAQTIERAPEPKRTALERFPGRWPVRPASYSPSWRLEERKAALDPGAVWAAIQKKVASRSAVVSALLFEVHAWTGFLHAFTHVSIHTTRMDGLLTSLVAVLIHASYSDALQRPLPHRPPRPERRRPTPARADCRRGRQLMHPGWTGTVAQSRFDALTCR